jgi:hypothetical protein
MRAGIGRWGLAVGCAACLFGVIAADEPSRPWYARWWSASKAEPVAKVGEEKDTPPGPTPQQLKAKAQADWQRRMEVCQRLREVAHENGDGELARQAEELEQRVSEAYQRQTRRIAGVDGAVTRTQEGRK